jgi:hypothetical protein
MTNNLNRPKQFSFHNNHHQKNNLRILNPVIRSLSVQLQQVARQPILLLQFSYSLIKANRKSKMPSRCSAGCHAPCSSAALRSGSSYVRHQALFIRSSFTHCTMLTALTMAMCWLTMQSHKSFLVCTITSPATSLFAWFHSLIRHYFISASCRPSAACCSYARRQAIACVPGLHWHKASLIYHATFCPFTVRPSQP